MLMEDPSLDRSPGLTGRGGVKTVLNLVCLGIVILGGLVPFQPSVPGDRTDLFSQVCLLLLVERDKTVGDGQVLVEVFFGLDPRDQCADRLGKCIATALLRREAPIPDQLASPPKLFIPMTPICRSSSSGRTRRWKLRK